MPKISPYSKELKDDAVRLLRSSGRSVPQLAKDLGVSPQSLRNWAAQRDVDDGRVEGLSSDEREELRRLRREVKVLAEERETWAPRLGNGFRDAAAVGGRRSSFWLTAAAKRCPRRSWPASRGAVRRALSERDTDATYHRSFVVFLRVGGTMGTTDPAPDAT